MSSSAAAAKNFEDQVGNDAAAAQQSTEGGDNASMGGYPNFKDQVGNVAGTRRPREPEPSPPRRSSDVPIAEATPITHTHITDEERLTLEQRNLELQVELEQHRVELERQKAANLRAVAAAATQQRPQVPPTMDYDNDAIRPATTNAMIKKRWICAAAVLVVVALAAAVVAGVCATGNCGGGSVSKPLPTVSSSPTTAATPRPVGVTTPRPSFRPATTILPARPSLSPATPAPVVISRPPAATARPTADRTTILTSDDDDDDNSTDLWHGRSR
jgi:hypothetical protein